MPVKGDGLIEVVVDRHLESIAARPVPAEPAIVALEQNELALYTLEQVGQSLLTALQYPAA